MKHVPMLQIGLLIIVILLCVIGTVNSLFYFEC